MWVVRYQCGCSEHAANRRDLLECCGKHGGDAKEWINTRPATKKPLKPLLKPEKYPEEINPRFEYDCGHCKFNWCCGELCACANAAMKKDFVKTPPDRARQVAHWQAEWRRYAPLKGPTRMAQVDTLKRRILTARPEWYAKHPEFPPKET